MRTLLFSILLISPTVFAASALSKPESAALKFNTWYMQQLNADRQPLTDYAALKPYVTARTIKAIKALYSRDPNNTALPDADMFIKAQDWDNDWDQISIISSEFDPVCTNVYVAFGKKQGHIVADCMVQESGGWKVQSVTAIK